MHESIGKEVKILSNLINRYITNMSNFQKAQQATSSNTWIIAYLIRNKDQDVFQKDLEKAFSITRSTTSKVIKLMEQKELIKREPVTYDRRLKKLILTDKAYELYHHVKAEYQQLETLLTQNISKADKKLLIDLLKQLQTNMKETM
ncbi:MAG: MarR family transcriptional regulator [Erysipelothrix sp.]|jgi:DNA-binding MarR family transcriptional regulator|nr:MarR family transcriptional regulator [Erysipelothrix sp.]